MYLYDAYRTARAPAPREMPQTRPAPRPYQLPPQTTQPLVPTDPWGRLPGYDTRSMAWLAIGILGTLDYRGIKFLYNQWKLQSFRPLAQGGAASLTCVGVGANHVMAGVTGSCGTTFTSLASWRTAPTLASGTLGVKYVSGPNAFNQVTYQLAYKVAPGVSPFGVNPIPVILPVQASLPDTRTDGKFGFPNVPETPVTTSPATQRPRRRDRERKLSAGSAVGAVVLTLGAIGAVNSLIGAFYRSLPARDRRGGRLGAAAQLNRVLEHWQDINSAKLAQNLLSRAMMMRLAGAAFGAAYKVDPYVGFGLNNAINQQDHVVAVHEYHG